MDLSTNAVRNLNQKFYAESSKSKESSVNMQDVLEIVDLDDLDLGDDETWLQKSDNPPNTTNIRDWLYGNSEALPYDLDVPQLKSSKFIDTRTFTRPKKKYNRPSISDLEQAYHSASESSDMASSTEGKQNSGSKVPQTVQEELEPSCNETLTPLQFDLSQPISLHNFDSFMLNSSKIDSFQNMSPPSLMNSLCSSTFSNLMESSFIKNDPVMREIRDKDFTEAALLQDMEAPMFQSITESFSSLNSDTPEGFLKKVARENTFRKRSFAMENNDSTLIPGSNENSGETNNTFEVNVPNNGDKTKVRDETFSTESAKSTLSESSDKLCQPTLNGTYRRVKQPNNGTFRMSDIKKNRLSLNRTFDCGRNLDGSFDKELSRSIENDMNNSNKDSLEDFSSTTTKSSGKTVILSSNSVENIKKRLSQSSGSIDLNRLSFGEDDPEQLNDTYTKDKVNSELNGTAVIKRSSLGSADSLDRMSSLSSSSKGSIKGLSMEDVASMGEVSRLGGNRMMSTPLVHRHLKNQNFWDDDLSSPIVPDNNRPVLQAELSDEYRGLKSRESSKNSLDKCKLNMKNFDLLSDFDDKLKPTQRTSYTITNQKPLQALHAAVRGSYSNIGSLGRMGPTLGGSQQSLHHPLAGTARPGSSNLKTMGTKLKGSYTSLKPMSANLPVAPPLNGTQTVTSHTTTSRNAHLNVTKTVSKTEMPPPTRLATVLAHQTDDATFIRPQIPRASGLPRPTGFRRPGSRIPAPRSANTRPVSTTFKSRNY